MSLSNLAYCEDSAHLRHRLSAVGQKVGGKKAELVERLRDPIYNMAEK